MSLPVSTVIVGCSSMKQLNDDLAVAESFVPMDGPERLAFLREIMPLVTPKTCRGRPLTGTGPLPGKRVDPRMTRSGHAHGLRGRARSRMGTMYSI